MAAGRLWRVPPQVKALIDVAVVTLVGELRPVNYHGDLLTGPEPSPVAVTVLPGGADEGCAVTYGGVVIRPIEILLTFVNHGAPSGPALMPAAWCDV